MPLPWLDKSRSLRWPALVLVICAAVGLTAMVAHTQPAIRARAADGSPHPVDAYSESVIQAAPPSIDPEAVPDAPAGCQCFGNALKMDEPAYYLSGFGGMSYADTTFKTTDGGMYGLQLVVPIAGTLAAGASGFANHYDGGTQAGGTIGVSVAGMYTDDPSERFGWGVAVDQVTDSQIDGLYLVQGRYVLSYELLQHTSLSVQYTDPYHGKNVNALRISPTAAAGTLPFRPVEVIQAMVTQGTSADQYVQFGIGYIDDYESMTFSAAGAYPVTDRISAALNASYDEKVGLWTGFVGLQISLSPRRSESWATADARTRRDIVRGYEGSLDSDVISPLVPLSADALGISRFLASSNAEVKAAGIDEAAQLTRWANAVNLAWKARMNGTQKFKDCNCPADMSPEFGICVERLAGVIVNSAPCL